MDILERLRAIGWSQEGAEFLIQHSDDSGIARFFKRLGHPVPAKRPERKKETIPYALRWQVWERDNFTCKHCGTRRDLSVDHIIPESCGGTLDLDNLQTLCRPCNSRKGNR